MGNNRKRRVLGGRKWGWLFLIPQTGDWARLSAEDPGGPGPTFFIVLGAPSLEETESSYPLASQVTVGNRLNLSVPQFLICEMGIEIVSIPSACC